jgi:hypothetical protein
MYNYPSSTPNITYIHAIHLPKSRNSMQYQHLQSSSPVKYQKLSHSSRGSGMSTTKARQYKRTPCGSRKPAYNAKGHTNIEKLDGVGEIQFDFEETGDSGSEEGDKVQPEEDPAVVVVFRVYLNFSVRSRH